MKHIMGRDITVGVMDPAAWQYRYMSGDYWSSWINISQETYNNLGQGMTKPFEKRVLYAAPMATRDAARDASIIERCAMVAEAKAVKLRSLEDASKGMFSFVKERFVCNEVATAIRALALDDIQFVEQDSALGQQQ